MRKKFLIFLFVFYNFAFSEKILKIVSGKSHTLILTQDGYVLAFGWNKSGQIGNGNNRNVSRPVKVKLNDKEYLKDIIEIGAGDIHSIVLHKNGFILTWGGNISGQLGNLTNRSSNFPVFVRYKDGKIFNEVIKIASGWDFSVALKKDGTVWTWGDNKYGQLGDGSTINRNYPLPVKTEMKYLKDIIDIKAGAFHILALKKDGTVWAWGDNEFGQLGDGTYKNRFYPVKVKNIKNIEKISCGAFHSLAVDKYGNLYAWGKNWSGQLGNGTYKDRNIPVLVKGENGDGYLKDVVEVSGGRNHTIVLTKDGTVYVFGGNRFGQLGNMILKKVNFPIRVFNGKELFKDAYLISASGCYSVVLLKNGLLYFWGTNEGEIENKFEKSLIHLPIILTKF
ncbi:MAG: hypothetical protein NC827_00120 [Candidatus Omnitrophica bacterium]|nr:hypothetical protein [Candidatus Omnitrophota bacterium]MCM8801708.1 hypothetical protein [Candidatus Omnitrophota bacterium]